MSELMRNRIIVLTGFILIAFSVLFIAFEVNRTDFTSLIGLYALGFAGLAITYRFAGQKELIALLLGGFVVRLLMINVTPELSNDFYRFIWDGEMMKMGLLPYVKTPDDIISSSPEIFQNAELRALYHGMGELSSSNYSNYPPINELFFLIAAKLGTTLSAKVMILRIFIILADIVIVMVGMSLLKMKSMDLKRILFFAINPFILLEFTANLHFEGVMIAFFLVGLWLYLKDMKLLSSLFFAFSILIKVFTIVLLPFFWRRGEWKKGLTYIGMVLLFTVVFAYPFFMNSGWEGYNNANALYIRQFEFNGGVYLIVRELVWMITGFNPIQYVGPLLGFLSVCVLIFHYYRTQKLDFLLGFEVWVVALLIFFSMATTVHPWYIGLILVLSLFTNFWFPLVWSFLVYSSYYFYSEDMVPGVHYTLITLEWISVIALAIYELNKKKIEKRTEVK